MMQLKSECQLCFLRSLLHIESLEAEARSKCEEVICTQESGSSVHTSVGSSVHTHGWVGSMGGGLGHGHVHVRLVSGLHHDGPNWVGWAGVKLLLYINRKIARCQATLGCLQHSDLSLTSKGGAPH